MGESRKTSGGSDKYSSVMALFEGGIYFDQPGVRITDEAAVLSKINRFRDSTDTKYRFTPGDPCTQVGGSAAYRRSAVQLEFFVDSNGVGKVRITNNCTVRLNDDGTYDYNVVSGSGGGTFQKYNIYRYHYRPTDGNQLIIPIANTYVSQTFGGYTSAPGGQIYVNGNVVIGGGEDSNFTDINNMIVMDKITVVATGNIWVADSIKVAGAHDGNMPSADNPNVLGLIAKGVVKVVNPQDGPSSPINGLTYQPIGRTKSGRPVTERYLPDPTVVEAAITVGGGGWGAENVGNRREFSGNQDDLIVCGSITEVIRGVVGLVGSEGYIKHYYIDTRLMTGILPGDIWFSGKYIPSPAGWHDRSINN
jgi:hypothetical protein